MKKKLLSLLLVIALVLPGIPQTSASDLDYYYIKLPVFPGYVNGVTLECDVSLVTMRQTETGLEYVSTTPISFEDDRGEVVVHWGMVYSIVETRAPEGYLPATGYGEQYRLTLDENGKIICVAEFNGQTKSCVNIILTHKKKTGEEETPAPMSFHVISADQDVGYNNTPLDGIPGFQYRITGMDAVGNQITPIVLSSGAGSYDIALRPGAYLFEETGTAAGYKKAEPLYFKVTLTYNGGVATPSISEVGFQRSASDLYIWHESDPNAPAYSYPHVDTSSGSLSNFQKRYTYTPKQFSDVPEGEWYSENVAAAYEYGLMKGIGDGSFGVGNVLTIGETLAIADRLHNIYYGGNGQFIQGNPWYQVYVEYAVKYGIMKRDAYVATAPATRAQFATIMYGAVPDEALPKINNVTSIPDVSTSAAYYSAALRLYNAGIIRGVDEYGNFSPNSLITRSEVVAIATRFADLELRKQFTLTPSPLQVTAEIVGNGTVTGTGSYRDGEKATLEAIPGENATFVGWYSERGWNSEPRTPLWTKPSITIQVQATTSLKLIAVFE